MSPLHKEPLPFDYFQGETFSVNLGSVEETMGISSGIRVEAIEINPGTQPIRTGQF